MAAFLIECLFPSGWRRDGGLFWRLDDVSHEANRILREREARGVRILTVRVNDDAIFERIAEREEAVNVYHHPP